MRRHPPADRSRSWLLGFSGATAVALLLFLYRYLDFVARGRDVPLLEPLVTEFTGVYGATLLMPLLIRFIRAKPLERAAWLRRVPAYLAVTVLFGAVHTTWMWWSREILFRLVGLGDYHYGALPARYAMEFPIQVLLVAITTGFVHVLDRYRAARERELRTSQLEASLARAQLQALQAQLQPHFLFNALNTISSTMYEDVDAADRMLARLSDLLRHVLRSTRTPTIPLQEELEMLEPYLDLMRARFGARLQVEVRVADSVRDRAVPALLLQPLVENAAQHGAPSPPIPGRIEIAAWPEGESLVLQVEDNGPGVPPGAELIGRGIGLTNTAERLRAQFGARARLDWDNVTGGGLRVRVTLPLQAAPPTTPTEEIAWSASVS
jgi:two-component system, LytTR family, sensor kinase